MKFPTFWFENTPQGKFMMSIAFGQSKYYIDNLSENVKRGFRQKLRNGTWPVMTPIGYLNEKLKKTIIVDPVRGPVITGLFKAYATGSYSIHGLSVRAAELGLVGRFSGRRLLGDDIKKILMNPFYYGLMCYNKESFQGKHEPLVTKELFDEVQDVLKNRKTRSHTLRKHRFPFLNLATCKTCGCAITAELQKGHHYYRCTKKKGKCPEPYTREELIDQQITRIIQDIALPKETYQAMLAHTNQEAFASSQTLQKETAIAQEHLQEVNAKLERLLDLHLEGMVSTQEYTQKKEALLNQKIVLEGQLAQIERNGNVWLEPMRDFFKAAHQAVQLATTKNLAAKSGFCKKIGSNFQLTSRTLCFSYSFPFSLIKNSQPIRYS